jgi:DNA-binding CsgD family transcriptional regulator
VFIKTTKGIRHILVSKWPFTDSNGKIIGTVGSCIDITFFRIIKCHESCASDDDYIYLGKEFNNEHITKAERAVMTYILLGYSAERIGRNLIKSIRTVHLHTDNIKSKLKCAKKEDIIETAFRLGLMYLPYDFISTNPSLVEAMVF